MLARNSLLVRLADSAASFSASASFSWAPMTSNWEPMTSLWRLTRLRRIITQPSTPSAMAKARASTRCVWAGFHQEGLRTTTTSAGDRNRIRNVLAVANPTRIMEPSASDCTVQIPVTRIVLPSSQAGTPCPGSWPGRITGMTRPPDARTNTGSRAVRFSPINCPSIETTWASCSPKTASSAVTATGVTGCQTPDAR